MATDSAAALNDVVIEITLLLQTNVMFVSVPLNRTFAPIHVTDTGG